MLLLDLPLEILRKIVEEAVVVRGIKRALRLRLVCKLFAIETYEAICSKRLLEDLDEFEFESGLYDPYSNRPSVGPLYQLYLKRLLSDNRVNDLPHLNCIRKIAKILDDEGADSSMSYDDYISRLSKLAVLHGQYEDSNILFETTGSFDDEEQFNYHLITAAAYTNNLDIIKRTVENERCSLQESSRIFGFALDVAIAIGNIEIVSWIVQDIIGLPIDIPYKALRFAAKYGHVAMVQSLLQAEWAPWNLTEHKDKTQLDAIEEASDSIISTPSTEIFNMGMNLRKRYTSDPLPQHELSYLMRVTAVNGWTKMAQVLLSNCAPSHPLVDMDRYNPLSRGCQYGRTDIVVLLLEHGAQPKEGDLATAAAVGHLDIVRILLDRGVRSESVWLAARKGSLNVVRMLLDYGMSANKGSMGDPLPIVSAVMHENAAMFHLLIERGTILDDPEAGGEAMQRAREAGLESMVKLLKQHGVDEQARGVEGIWDERAFKMYDLVHHNYEEDADL